MAEISIHQALSLAVQHHNRGQLNEAEHLYRQILSVEPNHADALHMLGIIQRRRGDSPAAIDLILRAISVQPACLNANFNLGNALRDAGRSDEAIAAYRRSISLKQNLSQSYHNLGCLLRDQGLLDEATVRFAQAKGSEPPVDWYSAGNSLREQRRFAEAITAYRRAIAVQPHSPEVYCNLGNALLEEKQTDAAIDAYRQAIQLNPHLPQAHFNYAKAMYDLGQLDEAIAANRRAIALRPDYHRAFHNLASCLFESGRLDEAIAEYRQLIRSDTDINAIPDSNLIYALHFHPAEDAQSIARETRRWNQQHAEPLARFTRPQKDHRAANRRLKIGYVSPDFRNHVVGQNLMPLFARHDHERFEIICYSDARPDAMTRWFQQHADGWHETIDLSDEQLADQIHRDQIDILVDLALHTQGNRLLVFARKPAPVQITFAGYPGSTGLTAIDYRISDPYLDPPGMDESVYSEKTLRLPHSFWCYDPGDCRDIPVTDLPASGSGVVTFGCLNNFCKVNDVALDLWAKVMQQVPRSRLILLAKHGSHRQRTIDYLDRLGVERDRIEFIAFSSRRDYLKQFHRIDISLDTYPYNGHTTSLDSLYMGVPVVTLVGSMAVSRAGWCQLSNLGLTGLAGVAPEQFVKIAVDLAKDLPGLEQLRSGLRARMEQSELMNAAMFATGIENAYVECAIVSKEEIDFRDGNDCRD
jgi:protein O-GlcNAc transferase